MDTKEKLIDQYMKNILFFILLIIHLTGCRDNIQTMEPALIIDFQTMDAKPLVKEVEELFFTNPTFIKLKNSDNSTAFGKIDQVKIVNDKIYILDERIKSLLVYEMDGNAISKVGTYGQGPQEYLDIASFDVDKLGNIYTIDGRLDKLFIYDNKLKCVSSVKLPFEVDQMQLLENDRYMFALSSWNKGTCEGKKIAITDKNLNVLESYLPYDEYIDENYWISGYQFIKTKEFIVYNRPIDNTIYLFSLDGKLLKSIQIDFGSQNVSNEMKKNVARNLSEFDNYCLLKNFVVITPRFITGTIWMNRQSKVFLLDIQTSSVYQSEKLEDSDNTLCTGFSDSTLISFIDPDYYNEYPDFDNLSIDIKEHLKNGDFVLCIKHVK